MFLVQQIVRLKMRRTFPRIPGSPQAPAIVETPTHNAPTLFCRLAPFVRGGEWECQSLICLLFRRTLQNYTYFFNFMAQNCKNHIKSKGFMYISLFSGLNQVINQGVGECDHFLRPLDFHSLLVRAKRNGRWWLLKGLKEQYRQDAVYQVLLQRSMR